MRNKPKKPRRSKKRFFTTEYWIHKKSKFQGKFRVLKNNFCRHLNKIVSMQFIRVWWYRYILSDKGVLKGTPIINIPTIFLGTGKIKVHSTFGFGGKTSPDYYSGSNYIEARNKQTVIELGENSFLNNGGKIIAEGEGVFIGNYVMIGPNFLCADSDFHNLNIHKRFDSEGIKTAKVIINDNVFIGFNVTILKGVEIGKNSVIAAGSVVTKSFPENVIIGGNPAKVIRPLTEEEMK